MKEGEVSCDAAGGLGVHAEASKDRKGGNVDLCLWARVLAFVFGCLSFQINVVLKRLELDSYWALNEAGTDAHLWNDRAGTEAIDPAHTSDFYSAQAELK